MDQERVEVLGEAGGRCRVPGLVELADQLTHPALALSNRLRLVERFPVCDADALSFTLGQLRQNVAQAMDVMPTSA